MSITRSGAITLSNVQTEFGGSNPISLAEYYRGGANVSGSNVTYSNYSTGLSAGAYAPNVPSSGSISIGDFYAADKALIYTGHYSGGDTTPVKTGFGFSSVSTSFNPETYLGSLLHSQTFLVCCQNTAGWPYGWTYSSYDTVVLACTVGTASSLITPVVYGKQWRPSISYNGTNSVTIGGQYTGGNTDFGAGQNFLQGIVRTS